MLKVNKNKLRNHFNNISIFAYFFCVQKIYKIFILFKLFQLYNYNVMKILIIELIDKN